MMNGQEVTKIIFIGSGDFPVPILEYLAKEKRYKIPFVITKAGMEKNPLIGKARENNVGIIQTHDIKTLAGKIKKEAPDLIILASFGQIISKDIIDIPRLGILNVHGSILPKLRGASPITYAILNGEGKTGVTLMRMEEKIDTGAVIGTKETKIGPKETKDELLDKLAKLSVELLKEYLLPYIEKKIEPVSQNDPLATYAPRIKKEDGHIDWEKSADEIERMQRALSDWPGLHTVWENKFLKLMDIDTRKGQTDKMPGKVFLNEEGKLSIACKDGYVIAETLQLEGKKKTTAAEFLRGYPKIIGAVLN